jgi:hypothetical protein
MRKALFILLKLIKIVLENRSWAAPKFRFFGKVDRVITQVLTAQPHVTTTTVKVD